MKKVRVNKELCIGCGACQAIAPEMFEIGDDGLAQAIVAEKEEKEEEKEEVFVEIPEDILEEVTDAADGCPTSAIEVKEEKEEK